MSSGVELCPELDYAWPLAAGLATLAWIRQARGDPAGAREAMREAERALPDQRLVELFDPAPVQAPGWRWPRAGPPTPPAGCGTTARGSGTSSPIHGSANT